VRELAFAATLIRLPLDHHRTSEKNCSTARAIRAAGDRCRPTSRGSRRVRTTRPRTQRCLRFAMAVTMARATSAFEANQISLGMWRRPGHERREHWCTPRAPAARRRDSTKQRFGRHLTYQCCLSLGSPPHVILARLVIRTTPSKKFRS
jgi:hypothetical protein